jgi:hypothetical protein
MIGSSAKERAFQASQSALNLPPHAAHRIFADRAAKDGRECPPHPTRIDPGKIGAGNQRIGLLGSPLVSSQRRTLPLGCLTRRANEPGARQRDLDPAKGPHQRSRAVTVTVAADTFRPVAILDIPLWAAAVAWASQRRVELALNHRLDEITYPLAQPDFDRVKPIVEKVDCSLRFRLQGR